VVFAGTRKLKCRAAPAPRLAAQPLHPSKSARGDFYRRMRATLGAPKAITAAAHKLARILFHLVSTRQQFDDSKFAADQVRYQKRQEVLREQLFDSVQPVGFLQNLTVRDVHFG